MANPAGSGLDVELSAEDLELIRAALERLGDTVEVGEDRGRAADALLARLERQTVGAPLGRVLLADGSRRLVP